MKAVCVGLLLAIITVSHSFGSEFGKNHIYKRNFRWYVSDTENFHVFLYKDTFQKKDEIARLLERANSRITDFFGISLKKKPYFFFFRDEPDFHANRIGAAEWGTGGFSEPFKNRFVMPYYTSPRQMRHVIEHEFTHIASFEIWYGGFWRSLSLIRLMVYPIPLWIAEGIAEFTSDIWDALDAAAMRDIYLNKLIVPTEDMISFSHLEGYRVWLAYKQSQAMLFAISEKFGKEKVIELVKQFPRVWEQSLALKRTVGMNSWQFDDFFEKYLSDTYADSMKNRFSPNEQGRRVSPSFRFYWSRSPKFSDGKIVFISDAYGWDDIFERDIESGNTKRLLKNRKNYFDKLGNAIAFDGEKIIFTAWKNENFYICTYENGKIRKTKTPFSEIRQIEILPDGGMLLSGDLNGKSDIFLADGNGIRNLTDDENWEGGFCLMPRRQKIIYSCERNDNLDLREICLASGKKKWLTSTPYDERNPVFKNGKFYFLSEKNEFSDIYRTAYPKPDFANAENITLAKTGVTGFDVSHNGKIAAVFVWNGGRQVYIIDKADLPQTEETTENPVNVRPPDSFFLKRGMDVEKRRIFKRAEDEEEIPGGVAGVAAPAGKSKKPERVNEKLEKIRLYRTKFTVDLFYPLAMFVVSEGNAEFYILNYIQASDITGNHNVSVYVQWLSEIKNLDYEVSYLCRKWKTNFGFFASGSRQTYWQTTETGADALTEDTRENSTGLLLSRPLDRNNRLELSLEHKRKTDLIDWQSGAYVNTHETAAEISLISDYSVYRFFDIVGGFRNSVSFYRSYPAYSGDYDYSSMYLESQIFKSVSFPNHILALRALGLFSWGDTPETFNIARWNRLRGISQYPEKSHLALGSAEYRFYLFRDIDYNVWWLVPPIFMKSLKAVLFWDCGKVFSARDDFRDAELLKSAGFGLRLNTMLFQTIPLVISYDRARSLVGKEYKSYFKVGVNW
ncbi:MAG: hypothetical protein J7L54_02075 [Elusimicrobia bacterium]|nr:hypothetical protein [Elusimicrobiota bacterium]